ncbi:MAG: SIS domain-containing protein [Trueperaceae bacterium]|nr:SIS domain-containing protein [Trueperaceae bacterium]
MNAIDAYSKVVEASLAKLSLEREQIEQAAGWLCETLRQDGLLYVTGTGHSHMLAEEVFYRAGGLAAVHPLLDNALMLHEGAIRSSSVERLEGFAQILLKDTDLSARDLLIVASNSGRNAFPIEIVLEAKKRGCKTVAITSLEHSRQVASRHSSMKRLFELADLVIDNAAPYGDAGLSLEGLETKVGPVSSITGIFLMNAIVVRAVELVLQAGVQPEIFVSANVEGNQSTVDIKRWQARIKRL